MVTTLLVLVAILVPWAICFWWVRRRAADLAYLTERARAVAEGELERARVQRAAMMEIVDNLTEGVLVVSPERRVVVANRSAAEMFRHAGDLAGHSVAEIVRKQIVLTAIDKAMQGHASFERVSLEGADEARQYEMKTFPVGVSPEIAVIALFIDVTTIERLERVRKDFVDDFSHEVRTPLAGLRSAAETLDGGDVSPEAEKQLRSVMQRQISRIERLVSDLSELNQIESGRLVLERHPVHLTEMLAELCDDFGQDAQRVVRGEDLVVPLDGRAQQIFSNLLDNACKHGGGREIAIEVMRENGEAVVRVSDRGPGIPPPELGRIFNRFHRVDRSRSQAGSGLGLAITKHLVAVHGGTIRAYNRDGGGATFEVRLPM